MSMVRDPHHDKIREPPPMEDKIREHHHDKFESIIK